MRLYKDTVNTMKEELSLFYSYIKVNKVLYVFLFFVAIWAYGFPLTQFTLSLDEENALFRDFGASVSIWSSQGRFGISILKLVFHNWQSNSITASLLAVTGLVFTSIIWAYALSSCIITKDKSTKLDWPGLGLALVFLTFPAHSENVGFSIMSFELGIGWIMVSAASLIVAKWAIMKKNISYMLIALLLLIFAISIYQAFMPVFICAVILITIMHLINLQNSSINVNLKDTVVVVLKYILVAFLSLVIYKIIDIIISLFIPKSDYVDGFFLWGKANSVIVVETLIENFKKLILGDVIFGSNIILPSIILSVLILLFFIFRALKNNNTTTTAWIIAALLVAFITSPFLMSIILGSPMPIRTSFVLALFVSSIWYLLYMLTKKRLIRNLIILVFVTTTIYQSQSMSQLYYSDYNRYQDDIKIANQIGTRILELDLGETPSKPVVFLGSHAQLPRENIIKQEILGFSFFEWYGGDKDRIGNFMSSLGYKYKIPTDIEREKAIKLAELMPAWPYKGSVALVDDLIIVNLSDNPEKYGLNLINDENKSMSQYKKIESVKLDKDNIDFFSDLVIENAESDSYILKAGNIDPYISISLAEKLEKDSFEHISFTIESNVEGDMQLFLLQENESYSEKYSGIIKLKKGMNKIICERQQFMNNLISLRIDPPALSVIKIKEISFYK
ncbi:hypothetical protein BSK47_22610 [Paenibacillus odorifer]|uniref:Glycosyltransferase RgtA/B/C/D-like domain-containing protein n=2 Tax=Paenibacillus TaxID=44249 RepID=A0AB36J8K0_9BACL|nr:hypothetical protein BSK47_22610 [Paenibacillus odorifer]